jgi:Protein of unknown function (DUF4054)
MIILPAKAPGERIDYVWHPPLDEGDTIAGAATIAVATGTAQVETFANEPGNLTVKMWLVFGTDQETSSITASCTTVGGRTWQEVLYLPVHVRSLSTLGVTFASLYPDFAAQPAHMIDYWLADAPVGTDWIRADQARMFWAAHNLSLFGAGGGALPAGVTSFKSGTFSATLSEAQANKTGLDATKYGVEYRKIAKLNGGMFLAQQPVENIW